MDMSVVRNAQATLPWFKFPKQNHQGRIRLFCFPYAGAGARVYNSWPGILPREIEVCPVNLPGREARLREPPFTRMPQLVRSAVRALLPYADKPFAFFGHSMGALVGFELTRHLRREYGLSPVHLFVSGHAAPRHLKSMRRRHMLPEPEFSDELRFLNGTPKEVLENRELMELIMPLLRADFELCETYEYEQQTPLDCPISAYGGLQDECVKCEHLEDWRYETTGPFSLHLFRGDHFFLHESEAIFLRSLRQEMRKHLR